MTAPTQTVTLPQLTQFIARAFKAVGMPATDADKAADLMAQADLMGKDAHGVFRLPQYIQRIKAGGLNVAPTFRLIEDRTSTALIDGDNGLGHLVMNHAADLAMNKAEKSGIAWVGARHSNHAGPAALYAMKPLKRDMIGIYVAVGSANHLPPWGGTEMLISTNPIAFAIPSGENPPIVLDMATTVAAYGKVKTAAQRGETMPEGWMIDKNGNPLTDPTRASEGFLLPIGGPKGYGLALVFGILAGTLNGAAFGRDVIDFNADDTTTTNTGHFVIALDIKAFADPALFKTGIDKVWDEMKSSPRLPGVDGVRLPGEGLAKTMLERQASGMPIPNPLRKKLDDLADKIGIATL